MVAYRGSVKILYFGVIIVVFIVCFSDRIDCGNAKCVILESILLKTYQPAWSSEYSNRT